MPAFGQDFEVQSKLKLSQAHQIDQASNTTATLLATIRMPPLSMGSLPGMLLAGAAGRLVMFKGKKVIAGGMDNFQLKLMTTSGPPMTSTSGSSARP